MQCPRCEGLLCSEEADYVTFEICRDCHGIWVSGEQFHILAVRVATEGQVPSSAKLTFEPRKVLRPGPDNPARNCPMCRKPMREFNYAYDSNVFLDRCEQCKGIWLDPNEVIDIAAHIQYNPRIHEFGKSLLDLKGDSAEQELAEAKQIIHVALMLLRLLIFRR